MSFAPPPPRFVHSIKEIASRYDAIVFDQWGVLHDGSAPYPGAIAVLNALYAQGARLAVLSNSGKRANLNARRIAKMGFKEPLFETVMTSGEALWCDIANGSVKTSNCYPMEGVPGDALAWGEGLPLRFVRDIERAEFVLLMGAPEDLDVNQLIGFLELLLRHKRPIYCTNPDKTSPRAGGNVTSPGAIAHQYKKMGGKVIFYGKPHPPVFKSLEKSMNLEGKKILMVGDSLEHDIVGAAEAGWDSLFVQGGIHRQYFLNDKSAKKVVELAREQGVAPPDFTMEILG